MKRRIVQASSSIKKDMRFSLGQIEIILVGQGGVPPPLLGYAPVNIITVIWHQQSTKRNL